MRCNISCFGESVLIQTGQRETAVIMAAVAEGGTTPLGKSAQLDIFCFTTRFSSSTMFFFPSLSLRAYVRSSHSPCKL